MQEELESLFDRLWPITRSLTGNGNRKSFEILSEIIDLKYTEVESGTECFDWIVPPEWNIIDAWIKDKNGNKIVDLKNNNLHILGYSIPVSGMYTYNELASHLYTLPDQPDIIPYLTSYYKRNWGFCLTHNQFMTLDKEASYEVHIDATLDEKGSMTIGEAVIKGETDEEILFSTYICHPSMANNELSGPLVTAHIYKLLKSKKNLRYTYRFLFVPETIGSIYALTQYGAYWKQQLKAGFVVTCIGDNGKFTYKRSRRGNSLPDRAVELILKQTTEEHLVLDFFPSGSDERQYCSPGFNLPVGSLMRTMYGTFPEYHTSADNKEFISFAAMEQSVMKYMEVIEVLEHNYIYENKFPYGEPQLGKRGLYPTLGSQKVRGNFVNALMWILNLSDGQHDLISISERSKIPFKELIPAAKSLLEKGVIAVKTP